MNSLCFFAEPFSVLLTARGAAYELFTKSSPRSYAGAAYIRSVGREELNIVGDSQTGKNVLGAWAFVDIPLGR